MGHLTPDEIDRILAGEALEEVLEIERLRELGKQPDAIRELRDLLALRESLENLAAEVTAPSLLTRAKLWLRPRTAALVLVLIHGALNYLLSYQTTSDAIAWTSRWEQTQHNVILWGLGLAVAIAVGILVWREAKHRPALQYPGLAIALSLALSIVLWGNAWLAERSRAAAVDAMLSNHQWCAFESHLYDPTRIAVTGSTEEVFAGSRADLEAELIALCFTPPGGFDGVITFDSRGILGTIPQILNELGSSRARKVGVIMGIAVNFHDSALAELPDGNARIAEIRGRVQRQLDAAKRAAPYVDAFCVGHNPQVPFSMLAEWIDDLRRSTGKPVTSTFTVTTLEGPRGASVRDLGDFLFVDIEPRWHSDWTPEMAIDHFRDVLSKVQHLPTTKACLLKMVSYPSAGGGPGLTEANQAKFFGRLASVILPPSIYVSVFGSHDLPWKETAFTWSPAESYVGLLTADPVPRRKPAFDVACHRLFPRHN